MLDIELKHLPMIQGSIEKRQVRFSKAIFREWVVPTIAAQPANRFHRSGGWG
jgi:hypothetical protein